MTPNFLSWHEVDFLVMILNNWFAVLLYSLSYTVAKNRTFKKYAFCRETKSVFMGLLRVGT